jgi:Kef-type K+ transport system membrane component KefB
VSELALAAVLGGGILVASTISVEIGLSVALIELALGVVVGNAFHPDIPDWLSFIGTFAGIVLTFLAGAEVDVPQFRREWRASVSIGAVSFFAPFFVAGAFAYWGLGWNLKQAEIAGIALSTTSLAVVYAVLVETGLNRELVGKRLMSATFVTDFGGGGPLDSVHQAERLDHPVRARLGGGRPLRDRSDGDRAAFLPAPS